MTFNGATADSVMIGAALDYASRGWPIFPCHPGTKKPLTPKGEDGSGGLRHATTDEAAIRAWWHRFPKAMIAVPTGRSIGAFVLDLDVGEDDKTGEIFEIADLEHALANEIGAALPATWTAETPRGGRHIYFALPDGGPPGNRTGLLKRIDVRGEGGYVIVPPSARPDGKAYRWLVPPW
jgi:putative DNA primase/helicase